MTIMFTSDSVSTLYWGRFGPSAYWLNVEDLELRYGLRTDPGELHKFKLEVFDNTVKIEEYAPMIDSNEFLMWMFLNDFMRP